MKERRPKNPTASVRQRLQNLSHQTGESFHILLTRYALERLLFYNLWVLSRIFPFTGATLCRAIRATFRRRKTDLPAAVPVALTDAFAADASKQTQWRSFVARADLSATADPLRDVLALLRTFLLAPLQAAAGTGDFNQQWQPRGPWQPTT